MDRTAYFPPCLIERPRFGDPIAVLPALPLLSRSSLPTKSQPATEFNPMAPQTTLPQLPVELLTEIMATTWTMPLTPQERLTFMKASILVNSTWAAIYDHVSSRDAYIPSFAYCEHFLRPTRRRRTPDAERDDWLVPVPAPSIFQRLTSLLWVKDAPEDQNNAIPDLACRSITIQVVGTRDGGSKLPPWTGWVLELLDALGETLAPNLGRLCVEYVNVAPDSAAYDSGE
ncbi:hypothetical protein FB45DRAFT_945574 [Roridomyces roridus]|uniref:Uncharacterized protein n=1 Tax=Roridomyces roridus TaxID=1738132 RepID=A0AAD7B419_9AGAR|nr:hypothetical protein FB45DRAFT_945574 [Roridomyces roridus]